MHRAHLCPWRAQAQTPACGAHPFIPPNSTSQTCFREEVLFHRDVVTVQAHKGVLHKNGQKGNRTCLLPRPRIRLLSPWGNTYSCPQCTDSLSALKTRSCALLSHQVQTHTGQQMACLPASLSPGLPSMATACQQRDTQMLPSLWAEGQSHTC